MYLEFIRGSTHKDMPSKYVIREYTEGGVYHIYNRGVEKRIIFASAIDYSIFAYYLRVYSWPKEALVNLYPNLSMRLLRNNLSKEIDLLAYCLMPNHFHLLVQQASINGVSKLMKQLSNAYTEYFNKKYKRNGCLMQGRYKAAKISTDEILRHVSRYIHINPVVGGLSKSANDYKWSSAREYTQGFENLCNKQIILSQFKNTKSYEQFLNDHVGYARSLEDVKHSIIE